MSRRRVVIAELVRRHPEDDITVYHLPDGPSVEEFQPVRCGGGISLHGSRLTVPSEDVCADCLAGNRTL